VKNRKVGLITGITGQDGSYLAELLITKGYEVHGVIRRASVFNTRRIDHLYQDPHVQERKLFLYHGDLTDGSNISRIIEKVEPDEIYNLGAQSHVKVSFEVPEYTAEVDALGTIRLLDAIKDSGRDVRFYQASSSEMFGNAGGFALDEEKPFFPRSPYAAAKAYAHWMTVNYREAYGIHASNGILFNHESERRGETFVTRKITRAAGRISCGTQEKLYLGNLAARRDWGYAPEYVKGMWLMLQQEEPDDYVLATGESHTVEEFCSLAFDMAKLPLRFEGKGTERKGIDQSGKVRVVVDPRYIRPTEVDELIGDPSKAREKLGWQPKVSFRELVQRMVEHDMALAAEEAQTVVAR
jgi:GDPmannose 4,6-dehydratase